MLSTREALMVSNASPNYVFCDRLEGTSLIPLRREVRIESSRFLFVTITLIIVVIVIIILSRETFSLDEIGNDLNWRPSILQAAPSNFLNVFRWALVTRTPRTTVFNTLINSAGLSECLLRVAAMTAAVTIAVLIASFNSVRTIAPAIIYYVGFEVFIVLD